LKDSRPTARGGAAGTSNYEEYGLAAKHARESMDKLPIQDRQERACASPRSTRRKRLSQHALYALVSAAARERAALPVDHPRRRPTLAALRFMRGAAE